MEKKNAVAAPTLETIDPLKDEPLLAALEQFGLGIGKGMRSANSQFGTISLDSALRVISPNGERVNYTMAISVEGLGALFSNLVVHIEEDSIVAYVLAYKPDLEWIRGGFIMGQYSGSISRYSLGGELLSETRLVNGMQELPTENPSGREASMDDGVCSWHVVPAVSETTGANLPDLYILIIDCSWGSSSDGSSSDGGFNDSGSSGSGTQDGAYGSSGGGGDGVSLDPIDNDPNPDTNPVDNGDYVGVLYGSLEDAIAELFEEQIDDSGLDPCMKDLLDEIKDLKTDMGQILNEIASFEEPFQWSFSKGALDDRVIAETEITEYLDFNLPREAETKIDMAKISKSSQLGAASILMHEAVHAYLQMQMDNGTIDPSYLITIDEFVSEDSEHANIVRDYMADIANSLKELGNLEMGLGLSPQFYSDLAWGGLAYYIPQGADVPVEYPWFVDLVPNATDRNRIRDVIEIELTGKDQNGVSKPKKGGINECN